MQSDFLRVVLLLPIFAVVVFVSPPIFAQVSCPPLARSLILGSSGPDVIALQKFLTTQYNNFYQSDVTGQFNSVTENAVKDWQSRHGIVSSGNPATTGWGAVGPRTAAAMKLCGSVVPATAIPTASVPSVSTVSSSSQTTAWSRTLFRGSSGDDVRQLQLLLIQQGLLNSSSATGYFGVLTEAALQKWQARYNVVSSGTPATTGYGVFGAKTRAAATAVVAATSPQSVTIIPTTSPVAGIPVGGGGAGGAGSTTISPGTSAGSVGGGGGGNTNPTVQNPTPNLNPAPPGTPLCTIDGSSIDGCMIQ